MAHGARALRYVENQPTAHSAEPGKGDTATSRQTTTEPEATAGEVATEAATTAAATAAAAALSAAADETTNEAAEAAEAAAP